MGNIEVKAIENNKKNIKKFVKFAWKIYQGNQYWVPPIISEQVDVITRGIYHQIGVMQPFLAYRDGEIVGRIIAHIDSRHNEYFNVKRGCLGFFECINDKEVSRALFSTAEAWLKERGMEQIAGPYNFIIYDASGVLLDDYEEIPAVELNYNLPYYVDLYEDYGFQKDHDWYAFMFKKDQELPKLFYKFRDKVKASNGKDGLVLRNANLKDYDNEVTRIHTAFNRAWEKNTAHYPLLHEQFKKYCEEIKMIIKEELLPLAFYNGELAGLSVSIPDVNSAIQKANGRLFPFGLIKILLGIRKVKRIKTFIMGVLPEYRRRGLDVYFYVETIERAKKLGFTEADLSLIVEDNVDMINALKHLGAKIYKTYRFYIKPIA